MAPNAKTYAESVLTSQPVGYWRLNETHGSIAGDATKNKIDGRYFDGVSLGRLGAFAQGGDKAVGFDGKTGYIEIPSNKAFSQPTSGKGFSVKVWFKPTRLEFPGETDDPYVYWIGKGQPSQYEWALRFYSRNSSRPNRISAYVFNKEGKKGAGAEFEDPVKLNEWIHVVACFDPGSKANPKAGVSIYKNGELRGSPASQRGARYASFDITPRAGSAPIRLGTRNFTSFFLGELDELAIYPRVLTDKEILEHFRAADALKPNLSKK
ncbi:LamG domain-containing protein [Telmatocola sphagniphila]|uniref:LamG domain-containing protein n=1 Tax=Telmatocola sphagniphila TaxID=1123043 RepID=A0A8E6B9R5_9BACT|nr:LamG domain-containing protein [Telmatocola sphagniphila]QVL34004.1 LamG domain-containing protein [Telmatocola sphagniphila]